MSKLKKKKNTSSHVTDSVKKNKEKIPLPELPKFQFPKLLGIIIVIAVILRLFFLASDALYYDEALCYKDSTGLTERIFQSDHKVHFLILRFFLGIHDSDFFLRLAPALAGIFSIFSVFYLGLMLKNKYLPIILSALFLFSEYMTFYAMDADYYSEMILYTILALIGIIGFLKYFRWYFIFLIIIVSILNFFTHPTSALFSASALLFMLVYSIVISDARKNIYNAKSRSNLISMIILAVGIIAAMILFRGRISQIMKLPAMFLSAVKFGAWAHNLDFNFYFFFMTFKEYGPSLVYSNLFSYILTPVFFIIFILGLAGFKKDKSPLFGLTIAVILISFATIFNTGISRFFHIRYTSFIAVLYLISIARGISFIGDFIEKKNENKKFKYPAQYIAAAAFIILFQLPTTSALFFKDYGNWINAMKYLAAGTNFQANSKLFVYNNSDYETARHYVRRYSAKNQNINMDNLVWTGHHIGGQQDFALTDLKNTVCNYPDSYFLSYWTEAGTTNPALTSWAEKNFTKVIEAPSKHEISLIQYYSGEKKKIQQETAPHQTVKLFKWKYPGTFLRFPDALEINISVDNKSDNLKISSDAASIKCDLKILADTKYNYIFKLKSAAGDILPASAVKNLTLNNKEADIFNAAPAALEEGEANLKFEISKENISDKSNLTLLIYPSLTQELKIPVAAYSGIHPSQDPKLKTLNNRQAIVFGLNAGIQYSFYTPESGVYKINIEGGNDKPAPSAFLLSIDSLPYGFFNFDKKDNSAEVKSITPNLEKGKHVISLFFLSEGNFSASDADQRNEGVLYSLSVSASQDPPQISPFKAQDIDFSLPEKTAELAPGWRFEPAGLKYFITSPDKLRGQNFKELMFEVPADIQGCRLIVAPQKTDPSKMIICQFDIKVRNLENHAANASIAFYDSERNPVGEKLVFQRGINQNTDWTTFTAIYPPVKGADYVSLNPIIMKSGKISSAEEAKIYLRNFKLYQ